MSNDINLKIRVVNAASKPLDDVGESAKKASTNLKGAGTSASGLTAAFAKGGIIAEAASKAFDLVVDAAKAVGAALIASAKDAIAFEKALAGIKTIAGDADMGKLRQELLDLSSAFGFDELSTAKAQYDLLSAGITNAADASKVLAASAELATAGMDELDSASKTVATAINAFSLGADDAAHITDVLAKTTQFGVLTLNELGQAFGQVAPIAAGAGVKLEETSAALAAITLSGKNAAESATGLKSLLSSLLKPSADLEAAFKKVSKESVAMSVQNKGLAETLTLVNKAAGGTSEGWLKLTGSTEAASAGMTLAVSKGKELVDFTNKMNDSSKKAGDAVKEMGSIIKNTADFQLKAAAQSMKNVGILFGSSFEPAAAAAGKVLSGITGSVNTWVQKNKPLFDSIGESLSRGIKLAAIQVGSVFDSKEFQESIGLMQTDMDNLNKNIGAFFDGLKKYEMAFSGKGGFFGGLLGTGTLDTVKEGLQSISAALLGVQKSMVDLGSKSEATFKVIGEALSGLNTMLSLYIKGVTTLTSYWVMLHRTVIDLAAAVKQLLTVDILESPMARGLRGLYKTFQDLLGMDMPDYVSPETAAELEKLRRAIKSQVDVTNLGIMAYGEQKTATEAIAESYKNMTEADKKYEMQWGKSIPKRIKLSGDQTKAAKEAIEAQEEQEAQQYANKEERLIDYARNWDAHSQGLTSVAQQTYAELRKYDDEYAKSQDKEFQDLVSRLEAEQEEKLKAARDELDRQQKFLQEGIAVQEQMQAEADAAWAANVTAFVDAMKSAWDISSAYAMEAWSTTLETVQTLMGAFSGKLLADLGSTLSSFLTSAKGALVSLRESTKALQEGNRDPADVEKRDEAVKKLTETEAKRHADVLKQIEEEATARAKLVTEMSAGAQKEDFAASLKEQLDNIDAIKKEELAAISAITDARDAKRKKDLEASLKAIEKERDAALDANKSSGLSKPQLDYIGKSDSEVQEPILAKIREEFAAKLEAQRDLAEQAAKESAQKEKAETEALTASLQERAEFASKLSEELATQDKATADQRLKDDLAAIETTKKAAIDAANKVNEVRSKDVSNFAETPVAEKNMFKELAQEARNFTSELTKATGVWFKDLAMGADDIVAALTDGVMDVIKMLNSEAFGPDFMDKLAKAAGTLINNFAALLPKLIDSVLKLLPKIIQSLAAQLPLIIGTLLDALINVIRTLGPTIIQTFANIVVAIIQRLPELLDAILEMVPFIIAEIPKIITALMEAIPGLIESVVANLPAIIDSLILAIPQIIEAIISNIPEIIFAIIEALPEIWTSLAKGVVGILVGAVKAVAEGLAKFYTKIGQYIWDGLKTAFEGVGNFFKNIGGKIFGGIWDGMKWMWEQLKGFGGRIFKGLWDGISGVWDDFVNLGKNIFVGFWNAMQGAVYGIGDAIASVFGWSEGGVVPGTAKVPGNSKANDTVRAMLSPGEIVIPRSALNGGLEGAVAFLADSMGATTKATVASATPAKNAGFDLSGLMAAIGGQDIVIQVDGREVARAVRGEVQRGFRLA